MSWILSNLAVVFTVPPESSLTAKVSYRKKNDPEHPSSYVSVSTSAIIHPDGSIPDLSFTVPDDGFIVVNVEVPGCGSFKQEFSYFPTL